MQDSANPTNNDEGDAVVAENIPWGLNSGEVTTHLLEGGNKLAERFRPLVRGEREHPPNQGAIDPLLGVEGFSRGGLVLWLWVGWGQRVHESALWVVEAEN